MVRALAALALAVPVSFAAGLALNGSNPIVPPNVVQQQFPVGSAFKSTPDPANIWSWDAEGLPHPTQFQPVDYTVVVDLDENGTPDQDDPGRSVLITDLFQYTTTSFAQLVAVAADGSEIQLWSQDSFATHVDNPNRSYSAVTPIPVPRHHELVARFIEKSSTSLPLQARSLRVRGRVVTH